MSLPGLAPPWGACPFFVPHAETLAVVEKAVERRDIFIPGFKNINSNANLFVLVFAVFKALLSSLQPQDICGVRRVYSGSYEWRDIPLRACAGSEINDSLPAYCTTDFVSFSSEDHECITVP